MALIKSVLACLVLMISSVSFAKPAVEVDLTDLLSPSELMEEMGISPDGQLWQASAANPRVVFLVDRAKQGSSPTAQTIEIYIDGQKMHQFPVSTGKEIMVTTPNGVTYPATTPIGEFKIGRRVIDHTSGKWSSPELAVKMPYAQFFNGGIAFHAALPNKEAALGTRDSGGCVRLLKKNAIFLWNLVDQFGTQEVKVLVHDSSKIYRDLESIPLITYVEYHVNKLRGTLPMNYY